MKGEFCEKCGSMDTEENPVVLEGGILLCLECLPEVEE